MCVGEGLELDKDVLGGVRGLPAEAGGCCDIVEADHDLQVGAAWHREGRLQAPERARRFGVKHFSRAETAASSSSDASVIHQI
jgi:hypothetical protein